MDADEDAAVDAPAAKGGNAISEVTRPCREEIDATIEAAVRVGMVFCPEEFAPRNCSEGVGPENNPGGGDETPEEDEDDPRAEVSSVGFLSSSFGEVAVN